jgi:DNA (cytosine-5)-methyltransferase 1
VVSVINPRAVLIENVVGILSSSEGEVPHRLLDALDRLGFSPSLHVLQAGGYGVPQNRWRVFFVGLRGGEARFNAPEPTHFFPRLPIGGGATKWRDAVIHPISPANGMLPLAKPPITVGDAIGDLPPLANGQSLPPTEFAVEPQTDYQKCLRDDSSLLNNHSTKRLGSLQIRRVHHIPKKPWSCWNDLPDELKPNHLVRQGVVAYDNRFGRLWNEDFFNTILTDAHLYWGRVIHPEDDRVISVRESARAQGIPDSVVFYGRLSSQYRQVGNAVPPLLAEAIGAKVVESFERSSVPTG